VSSQVRPTTAIAQSPHNASAPDEGVLIGVAAGVLVGELFVEMFFVIPSKLQLILVLLSNVPISTPTPGVA